MLATKYLIENGRGGSENIFIFPTDHYMTEFDLDMTINLDNKILCYRVVPTHIETGYGYIKGGIKKS